MEKLNNVTIEQFLNDYTENSETILLEEGRERTELEKIAKARGMDIKSRDLGFFKTTYAFMDKANANGAILPKKDFIKVLPQIIGKPVNINHDRALVVGHYIDFRYKQKVNEAIAYGVYYKSYYEDLWEKAQKLFKKKKLSTSFEIWSPKDKRKYKKDGTYELHNMEIAGGALIYEDDENTPAFKDAKVSLLTSKKEAKPELVYASKYKEDEIIVAGESTIISPLKLKCSNCNEEFETVEGQTNIKCPKCFAILDGKGNMKYPPQIKDFKILCPSCKVNNWLILSRTEKEGKIRCLNCSKEYNINFKKQSNTNPLYKARFVYSGTANCPQCNYRIPIEGISDMNVRTLKCPKCGLNFEYDNYKESNKKISKIEENIDKDPVKSSDKGEPKMKKDKHDFEKSTEKQNLKIISVRLKESQSNTKKSSVEIEYSGKLIEVLEGKDIEKSGKFNCECIKCNFSKSSDSHCKDLKCPKCGAQMRRKERPGTGQPGKSKTLTTKQRKAIPDSLFAEVKKIKNKKTGNIRKLRMFPMDNKLRVRKALARLSQKKVQKTLTRLGVKTDNVKKKLIRRAKELKMSTILTRYQKAVKKFKGKIKKLRKETKVIKEKSSKTEVLLRGRVKKVIKLHNDIKTKLEKELEKAKKKADKKIKFYKSNAKKILERQKVIGKNYLTDEEILNDDKFERARLSIEKAKENKTKDTASEIVGSKKRTPEYYDKKRREIDDIAFGRKNKE